MAKAKHDVNFDGKAEALKLMRQLRRMNGYSEKPRKSAEVVHASILAIRDWPKEQQLGFARVISWVLVDTAIDCGAHSIEELEEMAELGERGAWATNLEIV